MSDDEEVEYEVEAVLKRKDFERLLEEALASNAKFTPASIEEGRSKHSKYAYLVHWKGFPIEERTWEPESNVKNCAALQKFKDEHSMPHGHQKFEKKYGSAVWRNLGLASEKVIGYKYLMTSEEVQEKKLKKQQLANRDEIEKEKSKEKPRERMVTPRGSRSNFEKEEEE
ncbi:hypothetical protein CRE_12420 [Caenorhabditis remanei]|uniref:Chromo domain-containing protein n=1 Tax=Caenorhabditis remanei TaxID=31234 RepID=E3NQB1_CAERE|nr:hypothetical protein CRE_12420 [Caenorhabditis remanei]